MNLIGPLLALLVCRDTGLCRQRELGVVAEDIICPYRGIFLIIIFLRGTESSGSTPKRFLT